MKYNPLKMALAMLLAFSLIVACEPEEVIQEIEVKGETVYDTLDVSPLPTARILEYNIVNTQQPIYSSIDHEAGTITTYLPAYYQLGVIEPELVLPAGTTVQPESGALMEVFGDPAIYTVTAADGSTAEYTLDIQIQQAEIIIDEWSSEEDTASLVVGERISLTGQNFIPNPDITKTYLIGEDGREINLTTPANRTSVTIDYLGSGLVDQVSAGEIYWVEMRAYNLTKRMTYPFKYVNPPASLDWVSIGNVIRKQGETFTIQGSFLNAFNHFAIRVNSTDYVPLIIESYTETEAIIRIPDDFPVGSYNSPVRFRMDLEGSGQKNYTVYSVSIQVDPKE